MNRTLCDFSSVFLCARSLFHSVLCRRGHLSESNAYVFVKRGLNGSQHIFSIFAFQFDVFLCCCLYFIHAYVKYYVDCIRRKWLGSRAFVAACPLMNAKRLQMLQIISGWLELQMSVNISRCFGHFYSLFVREVRDVLSIALWKILRAELRFFLVISQSEFLLYCS